MAKVFLSYSRRDQLLASSLAKDLRDLGHTVWMDQELTGGQTWWDQILANIRACELFVFALSSDSLYSTACQREYGYAADLNRPILPVLVRDGLSSSVLPPALSQVQFLDFRARHVEAIIALARALQSLPLGQALPDPLPAPPEVPLSHLATLSQQIESPATLSLAEQSRLVLELKKALRDPTTHQDAGALWARLRARRDLLATIAEEMDEVGVRGQGRQGKALWDIPRAVAASPPRERSSTDVGMPQPSEQKTSKTRSWRAFAWIPSDPPRLRRVAQQKILLHWLVGLMPALIWILSFFHVRDPFGVRVSPSPWIFLTIMIESVSTCLLRSPLPLLAGVMSFLPLALLGNTYGWSVNDTFIDIVSMTFLGCGIICGSLSQWIIQQARKKLTALR
jgi:hypothetical protein